MVQLQIKEAIRFYNENRKEGEPEMTTAALAQKVLRDTKSSEKSRIVLFYQIVNGRRKFIDLNWLRIIADETGYPGEKLIKY